MSSDDEHYDFTSLISCFRKKSKNKNDRERKTSIMKFNEEISPNSLTTFKSKVHIVDTLGRENGTFRRFRDKMNSTASTILSLKNFVNSPEEKCPSPTIDQNGRKIPRLNSCVYSEKC